jgi:alpha-1,2-glucosyltransferase
MPTFKSLLPRLALPATCAAFWLASLIYARHAPYILGDEFSHVPQIWSFMHGKWVLNPYLTSIPGYHLLMAGLMKVLGQQSLIAMRTISATFGIASALLFHEIRRTLGDPRAALHAAAFFFLPFLYPYYFLVYTDTLSLALVLGALLATLRKHDLLAAIVLTASILVRQNNVVWAALMPLLSAWPCLSEKNIPLHQKTRQILGLSWPYMLPIVVFFSYWAWNGSISLSKKVASEHPDLSLHPGNVYFALFLFVAFFPVEVWRGARRFMTSLHSRPWLVLAPLCLVACVHLKGAPHNYISLDYFAHNAIIAIAGSGSGRWTFALAATLGACGICYTRFMLPHGWLIYPLAAFYLCSSWMIESRYAIVPFAIWMALRKVENKNLSTEILVLSAWILASQFFVWGFFSGQFLL